MYKISALLEKMIIGIELYKDKNGNEKKSVHYYAYSWYTDGEPAYRFAEYTFFYGDLEEVLKIGVCRYEEKHQELIKQYICDCSENEIIEFYETYDNGNPAIFIREKDISIDTPCGVYIII